MIMKIKEAENRFFREWVKEENLCSNGRKKEISNATSPANLTAGNDSVDIFLSGHNITNKDNIVKSRADGNIGCYKFDKRVKK